MKSGKQNCGCLKGIAKFLIGFFRFNVANRNLDRLCKLNSEKLLFGTFFHKNQRLNNSYIFYTFLDVFNFGTFFKFLLTFIVLLNYRYKCESFSAERIFKLFNIFAFFLYFRLETKNYVQINKDTVLMNHFQYTAPSLIKNWKSSSKMNLKNNV